MYEIYMSVLIGVWGVSPHLVQEFPAGGSTVQWGQSTTDLLAGRTHIHIVILLSLPDLFPY